MPSAHFIDNGSLPGNELDVCRVNVVRGGEVISVFSLGKGTKPFASSMTQLYTPAS